MSQNLNRPRPIAGLLDRMLQPHINGAGVPPPAPKERQVQITLGLRDGKVVIAFGAPVADVNFAPEQAAGIAQELMRLALAAGYAPPGMTIEAAPHPSDQGGSGNV